MKCGRCGTVLLQQGMPETTQSQAPEPARGATPETQLTFSWPVALKSLSFGAGLIAVGAAIAILGGSTLAMIGGAFSRSWA